MKTSYKPNSSGSNPVFAHCSNRSLGRLMVLLSAFLLYFTTVIIRWSSEVTELSSGDFIFWRFFGGFLSVAPIVFFFCGVDGLRVRKFHFVLGRAVFNLAAVASLYLCIETRTLAEGNILNLSYCVAVPLISLFVYRLKDVRTLILSLISFFGIALVINSAEPGGLFFSGVSIGTLWGCLSGLMASLSIFSLKFARDSNDTLTVLFYMFLLAMVLSTIVFWAELNWPDSNELFYLLLSTASGILGQFALTLGYGYVSAAQGSVIGTTRILFAAFLGPLLTSDAALHVSGLAGAILIFVVNYLIATGPDPVQELSLEQSDSSKD